MSANLDKSLGEIISSSKASTRGRNTRRRGAARAPAGGIAKNVAKPKTSVRPAAAAAAAAIANAAPSKGGAKKIMVSGLPPDVTERDLQDYFGKSVGPIQRIELSYGPDGRSRGHATIIFRQAAAEKAVLEHNGLTIDKKHVMRIEVVYDAKHMPPVVPPKSLTDRVMDGKRGSKKEAAKKEQPKKVKAEERGATAAKGGRGGATTTKRGRNAGRRLKKTAEELDMDIDSYFDANKANGGASTAAAAVPDAAMTAQTAGAEPMDEVL